MAPKTHALTQERLKELLDYDPNTGIFTWKVRRGRIKAGSKAGWIDKQKRGNTDYVKINIDSVSHLSHRLAWLYVYGQHSSEISHSDENGLNNKISNIKDSTRSQNMSNISRRRNNTSGYKGVSLEGTRFKAKICKNYKQIHIGTFDTKEEAHAAYCKAARELHGEFARF